MLCPKWPVALLFFVLYLRDATPAPSSKSEVNLPFNKKVQDVLEHPPFLAGASRAVIAEFHQLIQENHHLNDAQMHKQVDAWIAKQSPAIKKKFAEYKVAMDRAYRAHEEAREAAVAKFSPEAKKADAEMAAIASNSHLSIKEKHEKMEALHNSMPPHVRAEIDAAMQEAHL